MKYILQFRTHSNLLALSTIVIGVPIVGILASKLVFWPAILAILILLFSKSLPDIVHHSLKSQVGLILLALSIWGGLSCIWSISPTHSLFGALRFLAISCVATVLVSGSLLLSHGNKRKLGIWMRRAGWSSLALAFVVIGSVWGFTSLTTGWGEEVILHERMNYFNRTAAVLLALSWPISASIGNLSRPIEQWTYLLLIGALCYLLPSSALFTAFLFGIITFFIAHASVQLAKALLLIAFSGYILLIPFFVIIGTELTAFLPTVIPDPSSEIHRIKVWTFSLEKIFESPLIGYGFDVSQQIPGGGDRVPLHTMDSGTTISGPLMPLHPHSAPIQIWLELGIPGLCLLATFFYLTVSWISNSKPITRESAATTATLASCFTMATLSFDLWQGWWLFTLCSAAVLNVSIKFDPEPRL